MSARKHRPWKVAAGPAGLHKGGNAIARVVVTEDPNAHDVGHCVAYVFARTEKERERRALAVAAAPDLLAALKVAQKAMDHMGDQLNAMDAVEDDDLKKIGGAWDVVRAALAKATGGAS